MEVNEITENIPVLGEPCQIKVHDKVLAHLSRGMYRSPASALRELVSNAWDANATSVRISTNYPLFVRIKIEDNGDGFERDDFIQHMRGQIGNSSKRNDATHNRMGRPLIGRLGIGLLGIAQICNEFRVASRPRNGEPFQARVVLEDTLKEKLDDPESEIREKRSPTQKNTDGNSDVFEQTIETFAIGTFALEEMDIEINGYGTVIIADAHPMFIRSFQESIKLKDFRVPPREWSECISLLRNVRSIQEVGDYWRLLWELSSSCPIPYLNDSAVPNDLIKNDQREALPKKSSLPKK